MPLISIFGWWTDQTDGTDMSPSYLNRDGRGGGQGACRSFYGFFVRELEASGRATRPETNFAATSMATES